MDNERNFTLLANTESTIWHLINLLPLIMSILAIYILKSYDTIMTQLINK